MVILLRKITILEMMIILIIITVVGGIGFFLHQQSKAYRVFDVYVHVSDETFLTIKLTRLINE
ncbi:MAG: hypothetical protein HQK84_07490 [Nitrospinae bacterium]|nr:hypothetical protein [Nitrospinota bacterium]